MGARVNCFDNTYFLFFGSKNGGDIEAVIRSHHTNALSGIWQQEQWAKKPLWAPTAALISYPFSMVGYACDTARKVVLTVCDLFILITATLVVPQKDKIKWIKKRGWIVLDSALATGIALIGTVLPPVAYKLDAAVCAYMCRHAPGKKMKGED